MTSAIEIHSVTRTFGRSNALDAVSLAVPEGSISGLLGRNGAGKTTLMAIIAGQDRPTSGRVEVFGQTPFENESVLSQISFVRDNQRYPDNYLMHHVLRIAPDFAPNWSADVAAELVEGFRIPAKTPIKKFSRGQLSSVAIVLGLASRAPTRIRMWRQSPQTSGCGGWQSAPASRSCCRRSAPGCCFDPLPCAELGAKFARC